MTRTSRSWISTSWRRSGASEAAPRTVLRLFDDGADHHPGDRAHALEPPHERAPGPAHARADLRGHHARLSHRLYPHGDGRVLCLAFVPQCGPGDCGPTGAGPLRATHVWRDVERSEEHTSELQSRQYLVCRLLLEKKNNK